MTPKTIKVGNVWHVISEADILEALRRCEAGESADLVYAELYVNGNREQVDGT